MDYFNLCFFVIYFIASSQFSVFGDQIELLADRNNIRRRRAVIIWLQTATALAALSLATVPFRILHYRLGVVSGVLVVSAVIAALVTRLRLQGTEEIPIVWETGLGPVDRIRLLYPALNWWKSGLVMATQLGITVIIVKLSL